MFQLEVSMTRLEERIISIIDRTNQRWQLFAEGERLLVAVSGGKDSLALNHLMNYYPVRLQALHVRLSPQHRIDFIEDNGLADKIKVIETSIYDDVKKSAFSSSETQKLKKSLNTCFSCSRKRRKKILEYAEEKGFQKILIGHHRDDVVATLLLNIFFSREISTLMPLQPLFENYQEDPLQAFHPQEKAAPETDAMLSSYRKHNTASGNPAARKEKSSGKFQIIRPLYEVPEKLLVSLSKERNWQITPSPCAEAKSSKRKFIRDLLDRVQLKHPKIDIYDNVHASLRAIKPDFLPYPSDD